MTLDRQKASHLNFKLKQFNSEREKMAIILCKHKEVIDEKMIDQIGENAVVFSSDYYIGKDFIKKRASSRFDYYYFYKGHLFSLGKADDIRLLQQQLLTGKDYDTAKNFNEFLINVTRIKKLKKWMFYPQIIQLEHTNRCNARCIMCGHANVDKNRCYDILDAVFEQIETFLPFCRYVGLHGYGEPFLTQKLQEKFEVYRKYNVRLYANTNLSILPQAYLPYIADLFDEINVSMDGFSKRTFEMIRRGLRFETVIENIRTLKKHCPEIVLNIYMTLMRQNILEADKAVFFAFENGAQKVVLSEMIPLDANHNHSDSLREYPAATSYMLEQAQKRAIELGIEIEFPQGWIGHYPEEMIIQQVERIKMLNAKDIALNHETIVKDDGLLFNRQLLTKSVLDGSGIRCKGICDVLLQQIYVDADGTMAACCVDGFHSIGNIMDFESTTEYWESDQVRLLRDSFGRGELPSICSHCNFITLERLKYLRIL